MASQKLAKKLPKRASRRSDKKAKREEQHAKAKLRKAARIAAQRDREARNRELRAAGLPTPWEIAKAKRAAKRGN